MCDKTKKYAGKIARKRRVCGSCMYAVKTIAVNLNIFNMVKSHAR
jgi:hypothetical protein